MIAIATSGGAVHFTHHFCDNLRERKGFVLVLIGTSLIISGSILGLVGAFQMDSKGEPHNEGQTETGRLVSQAQFTKVAEVEAFFGGKDENDLRQLFDLPNILQKNINTQIIRVGFIKAGKESDFFYSNYTDNGSWIMWAKPGYFSTGPSGVQLNTGPKDVHHLVTTTKFQGSQRKLIEFSNSVLIPDSIKVEINGFNDAVNKDTELMMQILDEKLHEDEDYFLLNMAMGTKYYGVIVSAFAVRMIHLKPAADRVLSSIAASWKISR